MRKRIFEGCKLVALSKSLLRYISLINFSIKRKSQGCDGDDGAKSATFKYYLK